MRADEAFPSKYLKSSDVKDKPRIAVISHIERVQIGKGENAQEKYVLYFEGDISPMVLNRTNWEAIEDAFGDSDNWSGHKVKIKTARVQFQDKSVDGIRLDPIVPKPASKNEPDDEGRLKKATRPPRHRWPFIWKFPPCRCRTTIHLRPRHRFPRSDRASAAQHGPDRNNS